MFEVPLIKIRWWTQFFWGICLQPCSWTTYNNSLIVIYLKIKINIFQNGNSEFCFQINDIKWNKERDETSVWPIHSASWDRIPIEVKDVDDEDLKKHFRICNRYTSSVWVYNLGFGKGGKSFDSRRKWKISFHRFHSRLHD